MATGNIPMGVKIDTLGNPGWSLDIDLMDTTLEEVKFQGIEKDISGIRGTNRPFF